MAERVTRKPLCTVKGCPHPSDPDWHRCFVCGKQEGDHQHFPKKSLAGKGAKIVAFLCRHHHELITLNKWREGVYRHSDGSLRYYIQNLKGEQQCERIIEAAPVGTGEANLALISSDTEAILPAAKKPAVQYLPTGLVLPENLPFNKWQELVGTLKGMIGGVPWWTGDLVNFGERKYGERYAQAMDEFGLKYDRLANYAWVASKVKPSTRVENLSWSHHREVADLEPDEQRVWLQRAQDENLSANALRKAISGEEPELPCPGSSTGRHHFICEFCQKER